MVEHTSIYTTVYTQNQYISVAVPLLDGFFMCHKDVIPMHIKINCLLGDHMMLLIHVPDYPLCLPTHTMSMS